LVSLYFHIPFCTKKCPYCHFYVIPNLSSFHQILTDGLSLEWERQLPLLLDQKIVSIYFGGGTPSLFADGIGKILEKIAQHFSLDCEITVEANPEDASITSFEKFRKMGVNRLSLGVQSLDDRSLQTLERIHSAKKAEEAIFLAKLAGFDQISIDLMYDLPNQTEASWDYTLSKLAHLPIQHLSLYNLTIEPHTSFYKRKTQLQLPNSDASFLYLTKAIHSIEAIGLKRYEISAFGRPSIHNSGYWTGRPFLGFGPSAFSFWDGERFQNCANLQRYTRALKAGESPVDFREKLSYPESLREKIAVRLRMLDGRIFLSELGLLFYDTVASQIV
jgi:oxygen-independent coproporphyrinogen III oxidase